MTEKILCLDLSYYIFYRYYALNTWLKKQDVQVDFMTKYHEMFERKLIELIKKYRVDWSEVYIAKDCSREHIWRNALYDKYKASRNIDDKLIGQTFKETMDKLDDLKQKHGFNIIEHETLEADDVIALFRKYKSNEEMIIITNDNDYIQLCDETTSIINLQGEEIKSRVKLDPKTYLEYKIILGDKSDNITSIMQRIGPKTAAKLASDPCALQALFEENPQAKTNYELNKRLIDFSMIPEELQDMFMKKLVLKD
jgi:5'-3' exonuclease